MLGVEVEISASGHDGERSHKDVLEREIERRPVYTAVFDKVRAGSYTLWVDDVARERGVVVAGGTVAELDWSQAPLGRASSSFVQGSTRPFRIA
jgi:hypothetical protein